MHDTSRRTRALVFDMDGILIDSEPLWRQAEIAVFGQVGLELEEDDCFQTQGLRIDEAVSFWYARSPWPTRSCEDVANSIVERMAGLIRDRGEPMPGVLRSIDWAENSNWRLAVASSSSNFLIATVLERFGLADRFESTRSAEDEKSGKPDPGVYLSVASDLDLEPARCIAVEDSVNGLASAIGAGMRCIAIPAPETRNDARFEAATLILDSIEHLPEALTRLEES